MSLLLRRIISIATLAVLVSTATFAAQPTGPTAAARPVIVLIGGPDQGYPKGEHDYGEGVLKIERLIKYSPQFSTVDPVVKVFPFGFPKDLSEIADADVVVLYFGLDYGAGNLHPLDEPANFQAMERLMARGAGLVALHQSFTVSGKESRIPFATWLGAVRFGLADRTTEAARIEITGEPHPVARGLRAFDYHDEFYPTLTFSGEATVVPILTAKLHVQYRDGAPVFEEPPASRVIAWATERADGGRSFGFTGGHYLAAFDQPQIRTVLLNAILWAAKQDVPATGSTTNALPLLWGAVPSPGPQETLRPVLRQSDAVVERYSWGELQWFASRALGDSASTTLGRATIYPGQSNPLHRHPNCEEVLHVLEGRISQQVGDEKYELRAGDTVVVPQGVLHSTRNIGTSNAVVLIAYPTADRLTAGE
jgi:quercetin dioxygenase-like cupin family protein/type 1 glutamine amidotransferase